VVSQPSEKVTAHSGGQESIVDFLRCQQSFWKRDKQVSVLTEIRKCIRTHFGPFIAFSSENI
jgi:hypothetical protein